jgi:hypothetical protein
VKTDRAKSGNFEKISINKSLLIMLKKRKVLNVRSARYYHYRSYRHKNDSKKLINKDLNEINSIKTTTKQWARNLAEKH